MLPRLFVAALCLWSLADIPGVAQSPATANARVTLRLYTFRDYDFRLRPGSAAIDHGVPIPNVNDGFTGTAPDLGAFEAGQPLPVFGPRPLQ